MKLKEPKKNAVCCECNNKAVMIFKGKPYCEVCIYPDEAEYLEKQRNLIIGGNRFDGNYPCGDVSGINYRKLFDGMKAAVK
jgi:hypothetical protein